MSIFLPADHIFWSLPPIKIKRLTGPARANVVIIGGGMAGLSAAQHFKNKGCSVILLEKTFCGAGASGKSSGFITPDSEFSLSSFVERLGKEKALRIWNFALSGVEHIKSTIETYNIVCDYQKQDTLVVATSPKGFAKEINPEDAARRDFGYESRLYTQDSLATVLALRGGFGAVRYPHTFGINGYLYLQGLKRALQAEGVHIYEETPVLSFKEHEVSTASGDVTADYIVVCADRWIPDFGKLTYAISHVQTFLTTSAPLSDKQVHAIFPKDPLMVWDTDLIYHYFRITGENRLLVGGSTLWQTYAVKPSYNNDYMFKKLQRYIKNSFGINPTFEYFWPGLIGVSKDILPIAGRDKECKTIFYAGAAAGLPWAAGLGRYAADVLLDDKTEYDEFFSPYRHVSFGPCIQNLIGTRCTFALSHITSLKSF